MDSSGHFYSTFADTHKIESTSILSSTKYALSDSTFKQSESWEWKVQMYNCLQMMLYKPMGILQTWKKYYCVPNKDCVLKIIVFIELFKV